MSRVDHWAQVRDDSVVATSTKLRLESLIAELTRAKRTISEQKSKIDSLLADIRATRRGSAHNEGSRIARAVAKSHGVTWNELIGESRHRPLVIARHHAIWMVKKHTTLSLSQIGKLFRRDHTTILHAIRKHAERKSREEAIQL